MPGMGPHRGPQGRFSCPPPRRAWAAHHCRRPCGRRSARAGTGAAGTSRWPPPPAPVAHEGKRDVGGGCAAAGPVGCRSPWTPRWTLQCRADTGYLWQSLGASEMDRGVHRHAREVLCLSWSSKVLLGHIERRRASLLGALRSCLKENPHFRSLPRHSFFSSLTCSHIVQHHSSRCGYVAGPHLRFLSSGIHYSTFFLRTSSVDTAPSAPDPCSLSHRRTTSDRRDSSWPDNSEPDRSATVGAIWALGTTPGRGRKPGRRLVRVHLTATEGRQDRVGVAAVPGREVPTF